MTLLDRFMVSLGFHVEREGLMEFEKETHSLREAAIKLGEVMTAAAIGVGVMITEVTEGMNKVYEFAELNKLSAKEIDAMTYAGLQFGMTSDSMQESLGGVNRKLGEAAAGIGRGARLFKQLGMSARDSQGHIYSLSQMMDILANKMSHNNRSENIAIARRFEMDPRMVEMLEQGGDKLRQLREEASKTVPVSDEDYEQAHKVALLMDQARFMLLQLTREIAVRLMPWMVRVLQTFQQWFAHMREGTAGKFTQTLEAMSYIIGMIITGLIDLGDRIADVIKWIDKYRIATVLLSAAVAIYLSYKLGTYFIALAKAVGNTAKAMMAFDAATILPAIALGALAIAIALVANDLWEFYHGGESVIGQLQAKYPHAVMIAWGALVLLTVAFIAVAAIAFAAAATMVIGAISTGIAWLAAFAEIAVGWIVAFWPVFLVLAILALLGVAGVYLLRNWNKIMAGFKAAWHWVIDELKAGIAWIEGKLQSLGEKAASFISKLPGGKKYLQGMAYIDDKLHIPHPTYAGMYPGSSGAIIGKGAGGFGVTHIDQRQITNPIQVVTSDPDRAGRDVKRVLDGRDRQVVRNGQSAVDH